MNKVIHIQKGVDINVVHQHDSITNYHTVEKSRLYLSDETVRSWHTNTEHMTPQ